MYIILYFICIYIHTNIYLRNINITIIITILELAAFPYIIYYIHPFFSVFFFLYIYFYTTPCHKRCFSIIYFIYIFKRRRKTGRLNTIFIPLPTGNGEINKVYNNTVRGNKTYYL